MFTIPSAGVAVVLLALRDTETGVNEHDVAEIEGIFIENFQRIPGIRGSGCVRDNRVVSDDDLERRLEFCAGPPNR